MDGIGASDFRGCNQVRDAKVRVPAGRGSNTDIIVGKADVERLAVGLAVNRYRLDPQLSTGPNDPEGDLATIGDEYLLEHA